MEHKLDFVMRTPDFEQEYAVQKGLDIFANEVTLRERTLHAVLQLPPNSIEVLSFNHVNEADGGFVTAEEAGGFILLSVMVADYEPILTYCEDRHLPEPVKSN